MLKDCPTLAGDQKNWFLKNFIFAFLVFGLLDVSLESAHAQNQIKLSCKSLLKHALTDPQNNLLEISDEAILNTDPESTLKSEPIVIWTQKFSQTSESLKAQLHKSLDLIIEQSLAPTPFSNLLEKYPDYHFALDKIKNYLDLFVDAYTNPQSGFVDFSNPSDKINSEYVQGLQIQSKQLLNEVRGAIQFAGPTDFSRLFPIPRFIISGVKSGWSLQIVPIADSPGFHLLLHNVKEPNLNKVTLRHNKILAGKLRDLVIGEPPRQISSVQTYAFANPIKQNRVLAGNALRALEELAYSSNGRLNFQRLTTLFMTHANLQTIKTLCGTYFICEGFGIDFKEEFAKFSKILANSLVANDDNTFSYSQNSKLMDIFFSHQIAKHYSNKPLDKMTFLPWSAFRDFGKRFSVDFDPDEWSMAIGEMITNPREHSELERANLYFHNDDHFLAGRVKPELVMIGWVNAPKLHTTQKSLIDLSLAYFSLRLKPSDIAFEKKDLSDAHMKLLFGRMRELLGHPNQ